MKKELINKLKQANDELIIAIDSFPKEKREATIFDQWTLKQVMGHISGWNLLRLKELSLFLNNKPITKITDFETYNKHLIAEREGKDWEYLYDELKTSCEKLIEVYTNINPESFNKKIWNDSTKTVKDWLLIDLDHWNREHLTEIKKHL